MPRVIALVHRGIGGQTHERQFMRCTAGHIGVQAEQKTTTERGNERDPGHPPEFNFEDTPLPPVTSYAPLLDARERAEDGVAQGSGST